jgi:hypothetical protein
MPPVLGPGEPVLCRKLWHGAVMTALPMRVVSDSPERTVLYLAEVENRVRAEAARVIGALAANGSPFCESEWLGWRPPADWTIPALPED